MSPPLWQPAPAPAPSPLTLPPERLWVAAALAWVGAMQPLPVPLVGLHKIYLGQPGWGGVYWLLGWTPLSRVAAAVEGVWYVAIASGLLGRVWGSVQVAQGLAMAQETQAMAVALRELESLRQGGLITEQEFETRRRQLVDSSRP